MQRVGAGAPQLLSVMDVPDGAPGEVGPDDEVARVDAMLGAARLGGGL